MQVIQSLGALGLVMTKRTPRPAMTAGHNHHAIRRLELYAQYANAPPMKQGTYLVIHGPSNGLVAASATASATDTAARLTAARIPRLRRSQKTAGRTAYICNSNGRLHRGELIENGS